MNLRGLTKKLIPTSLFHQIEPYGHQAEAVLYTVKNGFPAKGLNVIGVTGTNGKTSTCFLIHKMLTEAGIKAGLMTTVAYGVGDDIKPQVEHMTTVSVPLLHKRIKQMRAEGMEWLVLEVTSHALAQHRIWGVPISVAVMTNITHEHLDYHGSFEAYLAAKRLLFKHCNRNSRGLRVGIVNADDPHARQFAADVANPLSSGLKQGDVRATKVKLTPSGSRFVAVAQGKIQSPNTKDQGPNAADQDEVEEYRIECHLPGSFNVSNALLKLIMVN